MALDLLGESLDKLMKKNENKFSLPTILLLAQQMVFIICSLHL